METDPKRMAFWNGGRSAPVEGEIETCRTVFPTYAIGHWCDLGVAKVMAYATIEKPGYSELRVVHPCGEGLARHYIRMPA